MSRRATQVGTFEVFVPAFGYRKPLPENLAVNLSQVNKECNGEIWSWITKMAIFQKLVARSSRYNQRLRS